MLPDCRAYELVTPPTSNGRLLGDYSTLQGNNDKFPVEPFDGTRDSIVFSTVGSSLVVPAGGLGSLEYDLYEAVREPSGWQTVRHMTPRPDESLFPIPGGFSADHQYIFIHVGPAPVEPGKWGSLYQASNAGYLGDSTGHFELIGTGSLGAEKLAQGRYISPDGAHIIFSTGKTVGGSMWCDLALATGHSCAVKKLEQAAPQNGTGAIYDRAPDGPTRVISLLPGNVTPPAGKEATYQGASAAGTVVAFKIDGDLYVRLNGEKTEAVGSAGTFAGLSAGGSYLFYISGGNIKRFDTATEETANINSSGDANLVNVSQDGSRVYFASESQLDGSKGIIGKPNLYIWSGGSPEFIGTLDPEDLEGTASLAHWTAVVAPTTGAPPEFGPGTTPTPEVGPGTDTSRTTPDGHVIVFESRAQLTSYANTEAVGGDCGDPKVAGDHCIEIFRYDAVTRDLKCLSCGAANGATADAHLQDPGVAHYTTTIHNLSADGHRVFFETSETLLEADVNDINDIYEWEAEGSSGFPTLGLISPGNMTIYPSPGEGISYPQEKLHPNSLLGISSDGSDVIFLSQDALIAGAGSGGVPAVYDARIDGGFTAPAGFASCATASECRGAPESAPLLSTPPPAASKGNVKARKLCAKKKHRGSKHKRRFCHRTGKKR